MLRDDQIVPVSNYPNFKSNGVKCNQKLATKEAFHRHPICKAMQLVTA